MTRWVVLVIFSRAVGLALLSDGPDYSARIKEPSRQSVSRC